MDMSKLQQIERLIENTITKLPVPKELGESPPWKKQSSQGTKRKGSSQKRKKQQKSPGHRRQNRKKE
jgi:hypothetical protein